MSDQQNTRSLDGMNFSDAFTPLMIKDEPLLDENYGIMTDFSITDLGDQEIKLEIKEEPTESTETAAGVAKSRSRRSVAPKVIQESATEREPRPRRTTRRLAGVSQVQTPTLPAKKVQPAKMFNLKEITRMSGRQLVQNFSEPSSNEMTRYFAYTCCLMPEICSNFFTSFGSETDARNRMQKHLAQHIKDLEESSRKDPTFEFYTESIFYRAIEEAPVVKRRSQAKAPKETPPPPPPPPQQQQQRSDSDTTNKHAMSRRSSRTESTTPASKPEEGEEDKRLDGMACLEIIDLNDIKLEQHGGTDDEDQRSDASEIRARPGFSGTRGVQKRKRRAGEEDADWRVGKKPTRASKKQATEVEVSEGTLSVDRETRDKEAGRGEVVRSKMPWHLDHPYDVRRIRPAMEGQEGDVADLDESIHYYEKPLPKYSAKDIASIEDGKLEKLHFSLPPDENMNPHKLIIPILTVPLSNLPTDLFTLPNNPFEECDDIELPPSKPKNLSDDGTPLVSKPASSSEFEIYRELDFSVDVSEEEIRQIESLRGRWTHDHIRLLSKYYLKELEESKGKNRKKKTLCGCKICPNKKFTALTTLYYHYISHTGEKPFKCSRCDKGFTRRHSLNYHAMTHNNTNRFKCPVCLKQFRHTSHYKDHVKQHTGENESNCKICCTTFKSKTAFNRHLKTKHNVLMIGSNKASRVMSPSKINQLHLEQEAEMATWNNPVVVGTVENLGILNTVISGGPQLVRNGCRSPMTIVELDGPAGPAESSLIRGREVKVEPCNEGSSETSPSLPPNVIVVQPEGLPLECFSVLRRKPNILKARLSQKS